jgi:serine/threonine-protein kinase HipA
VTRRFDRRPEKIHTEDMAQILRRTQGNDKYSGSFEIALDKLREISGPFQGITSERFVKLCLFNYLLHNSDNHHKNHSVIILPPQPGGARPRVTLSPAYDVLPTSPFIDDKDQVAVSICGKKSNVTKNNWQTFFERAGLRRAHVDQFVQNFARQLPFVESSLMALGVEEKLKVRYMKDLEQRIVFLEGSGNDVFPSTSPS